jgi:TRAP-type C4-dicarboxylate transport system substrate-binding protein
MMRGWIAGFVAAWLAGVGAAQADETTLIFATDGPTGTHVAVRVFHPWADHINEVGKGVLHLDVRDGMSIVNPTNFYDRVQNDVVQLAWGSLGNLTGTFPHAEFSMLPFQAEKSVDASVAFWRLYKNGQLDPDFKDVVPLMMTVYPQADVHLAKAPKAPLDTLQGLRLMVVAKVSSQAIAALGGSPSSLPLPELYPGLQHSTVDGAVIAWTAFQPYKLAEVTSYHYEMRLGASTGMVFMAKKRFDGLSPAAQKVLMDNSGEAMSRSFGAYLDGDAKRVRDAVKATSDQSVTEPTAARSAEWRNKVTPNDTAYVNSVPNGPAIFATYNQLLAAAKSR